MGDFVQGFIGVLLRKIRVSHQCQLGGVVVSTIASHAEGPRFKSSRKQVVQSPSCEFVRLRLELPPLARTINNPPHRLVQCFGMEWLRVAEKEISTSGNPFSELTWHCICVYQHFEFFSFFLFKGRPVSHLDIS